MQSTPLQPLSRAAIADNAAAIRSHIRRTPVMMVEGEDFGLPGVRCAFKFEFLQHAGSFKSRGAFTHLLSREAPAAGVVAASGGNHGAAVAYAARRLGRRATIFVPQTASPAKLDQIRASGADLRLVGQTYAEAFAASEAFVAQTGALPIHAYDQYETLLGQASVGMEIEEDLPALDALLVAVGGGGLIGGIAAWYESRTAVIGVEPRLSPTLTMALAAGEPVDAPAGGIAADSLAPKRVGSLMFPIAQRHVKRVVLVDDDAIRDAQRTLWRELRIVVEPGGAAAFAALVTGAVPTTPGQTIGILLCGANTTAVDFG